jgi:hypothetical protein
MAFASVRASACLAETRVGICFYMGILVEGNICFSPVVVDDSEDYYDKCWSVI